VHFLVKKNHANFVIFLFYPLKRKIAMTRIKEPLFDSSELPDYKSPPSRIVRSLRQGYDNVRKKVANKSSQIRTLQGKLRDTQNSREEWKERTKELEEKVEKLEQQNEQLKKKNRTIA
jgi:peptidoglycan hydrolase CwlO-like protein